MRVDTLCDVAAGMAEDAALSCFVRSGIVKQGCDSMPAIVCCMAGSVDELHD